MTQVDFSFSGPSARPRQSRRKAKSPRSRARYRTAETISRHGQAADARKFYSQCAALNAGGAANEVESDSIDQKASSIPVYLVDEPAYLRSASHMTESYAG